MTSRQKKAFAKFILAELAKVSEHDGIDVLRRICMNSKDIRARLSCIRMLAAEVAASEPQKPSYDAKWAVRKVAPR